VRESTGGGENCSEEMTHFALMELNGSRVNGLDINDMKIQQTSPGTMSFYKPKP